MEAVETIETASVKTAPEKRKDQMSCREGGQADYQRTPRETGWGRICRERHQKGLTLRGKHANSRKAAA